MILSDKAPKVLPCAWSSLTTSVFSWESILGAQVWPMLVQHPGNQKKESDFLRGEESQNILGWMGPIRIIQIQVLALHSTTPRIPHA